MALLLRQKAARQHALIDFRDQRAHPVWRVIKAAHNDANHGPVGRPSRQQGRAGHPRGHRKIAAQHTGADPKDLAIGLSLQGRVFRPRNP